MSSVSNGGSSRRKKPFRYSIEWCSAQLEMADAEMVYDCIVEQIEVEGGFVQGGFVQQMSDEDVVAGSPLDKALT